MKRGRKWAPLLAASLVFCAGAPAQDEAATQILHGASLVGPLKYPPDFAHFDYVNPEAPKGGRIRVAGPAGSFDSFNGYIVQGTPEVWVNQLLYDTLLADSYDQPSTMYGELAESLEMPDDYSWVIYTLREEARFHDGMPVTADDIVFSLQLLREKGAPLYRFYYQNVIGAEALDERRVKFTFDETGNRELPYITGQLPALPKHYWEGVDENGQPRDFGRSSLVPPLGSGPYRIGRFEQGRYVEYVRVDDYWGRNVPVNVGMYNFNVIRVDYYRDNEVALQALFADEYDIRYENTARNWATAYDRPPVRNGSIKREEMPFIEPITAQSWILNLRRDKFSDRRVRQALGLAFNFEWVNANIFYGQYERVRSYFHSSELASGDLPSADELELLERFRDQLPEELFVAEYAPPVSDGTETNRNNLYRALQLLQDAGWQLRGGSLVDAAGDPFEIEFLVESSSLERIIQPYIRDLEKLGIRGSIRLVDATQYTARVRNHDFDVFLYSIINSLSPGNEQRDFWGSAAADEPGSRNFGGVKNPAVDALVEELIFAPDREALVTATQALDRVLLWNFYTIPAWTSTVRRYAYWDRFGRPDVNVEFGPTSTYLSGIAELWWSREAEQ
jgi:microcin C transport system substrate-binding protein